MLGEQSRAYPKIQSCLRPRICFLFPRSQKYSSIFGERTRAKLNKSEMNKIQIMIPSDEDEQTAIAEVLSDMGAEIAVLEQRRDKTRALKQGMMQELLTGRTRLV